MKNENTCQATAIIYQRCPFRQATNNSVELTYRTGATVIVEENQTPKGLHKTTLTCNFSDNRHCLRDELAKMNLEHIEVNGCTKP